MSFNLRNKRIVLGIGNEPEAYKSPAIVRELTAGGAQVKVVLSKGGERFAGKQALEAESGGRVHTSMFPPEGFFYQPYHTLSQWAEAALIAPAGADIIAKMACGLADDLLSNILLSFSGQILVVPALDQSTLNHPAVRNNLKTLVSFGVKIRLKGEFSAQVRDETILQCSDFDPAEIADWTGEMLYSPERDLKEVNILITAGPTVEEIDPVRFLSNRSSGRMGLALAEEACRRGALVTLIYGPISLPLPSGVNGIAVKSAVEMFEAVKVEYGRCRGAIMAAAVADYRPLVKSIEKLKKGEHLTLELTANPDILGWMGENRRKQFLVGFALEDSFDLAEARRKLSAKKADLIVLNTAEALEFESSRAVLVGHNFEEEFPLQNKRKLAQAIIDRMAKALS